MTIQKEEQQEALRLKCLDVWQNDNQLDAKLLKEFAYSGDFAKELLKQHPFYETDYAIEQISVAFNILETTRNEIIDQYGIYHASVIYDGFEKIGIIEKRVTSEVFRFAFAVSSLVQTYRSLKKLEPKITLRLDDLTMEIFDNKGLKAFFQRLRNSFGHDNIFKVNPTGTIKLDKEKTVESSIVFNKEELLSRGDWNVYAVAFIEQNGNLNVVELIDLYFKKSKKLHQAYLAETGLIKRKGYSEFSRCRQAQKTVSEIMSLGIILQSVKTKGVNPYKYLSEYFTASELQRIFCFDVNSKEQVDYIINLRDPLGLCEDNLRNNLYKIFDCSA